MLELNENVLTSKVYRDLRESVNWKSLGEDQIKKALKNSYCTITVFYNNNAIGMGRIVGDGIYFM